MENENLNPEINVETEDVNPMMNQNNETLDTNPVETLRRKYENWDLVGKSREEQVKWFQERLVTHIARTLPIALSGRDMVEEIYVIQDLADVVHEALSNPEITDELLLEAAKEIGVGEEALPQLRESLNQYCENIEVKETPIDSFLNPLSLQLPPESVFIQVITKGHKERSYIEAWDQKMQLTQSLRQSGCPVIPNYEEKRMLFMIAHLLNRITQMENKIQMATGKDINML